jgi:hypothetical protein
VDKQAKIPPEKPKYGYMNFFLNTNKEYLPDAPPTFSTLATGQTVYCDLLTI